jgi:hypothetical protein
VCGTDQRRTNAPTSCLLRDSEETDRSDAVGNRECDQSEWLYRVVRPTCHKHLVGELARGRSSDPDFVQPLKCVIGDAVINRKPRVGSRCACDVDRMTWWASRQLIPNEKRLVEGIAGEVSSSQTRRAVHPCFESSPLCPRSDKAINSQRTTNGNEKSVHDRTRAHDGLLHRRIDGRRSSRMAVVQEHSLF